MAGLISLWAIYLTYLGGPVWEGCGGIDQKEKREEKK